MPINLTYYDLKLDPPVPAPWSICALDQEGEIYINPSLFSEEWRRFAFAERVTIFVRIPEGIIGLVALSWIALHSKVPAGIPEKLEPVLRSRIANAPVCDYQLASVSLPGDPAFTDAVLRTLAGNKN